MADEMPTPGELTRLIGSTREDLRSGFVGVNARLDKMVTTELFTTVTTAEQRRVDDRLKDLADDIAAERQARTQAFQAEEKARLKLADDNAKAIDKLTTNLRWVAVSIVLPIGLFVANILLGR